MWAMGCVLAGLWLKKNLFYIPGYRNTNGQNLFALHLMQIILGCRLPQEMVASVPKRIKERYFYLDSKTREYCLNPSPYSIPGDTLEEIIDKAPLPLGCSISDRDLFKNLLRSLLNIDPSKRIASKQVLDHPFVEKDKLVGFTIDLKNLSEIQTDKHVIISIFVINEERKLVLFKCHSYSQYLGKCLHMKKTEDDKYFIQIFDEAESPLCDPKLLDLSEIRTIKIEMNDSEVVSIGH
jgi:serine/threonine protein kinase